MSKPTWSLPKFIGMKVLGDVFEPPYDKARSMKGVKYVRVMSVTANGWEMYVAADPEESDTVARNLSNMPGVMGVEMKPVY